MKSFVIYVKSSEKSRQYAEASLQSCWNNFEAELFEGVERATLQEWDDKLYNLSPIVNSRAVGHFLDTKERYETKKSCFLNHVRLWQKCVELNETIAIIEHDAHCVRSWDNIQFDELLILNITSAFKQTVFDNIRSKVEAIDLGFGLKQYSQSPLKYTKNNLFKDSLMMPGTAAYAVTPKGAKRLLSHLEHGWEQSDYYINTKSVNIEYVVPEYFSFRLPNLRMSHGESL
jgi:GR25 family glycosyltransferase involved in LPS biosynthesis